MSGGVGGSRRAIVVTRPDRRRTIPNSRIFAPFDSPHFFYMRIASRLRYRAIPERLSLRVRCDGILQVSGTFHYEEKYLADLRPIIPYPTGRLFGEALTQALRASYDRVVPPGQ